MATKYTKDNLIETIIESNKASSEVLGKVASAIQAINDTNVLHAQSLNKNNDTLQQQNDTIQKMVDVNTSFLSIFRWIVIISFSAFIVLAGAEKALKIIPIP